MFSALPPQVEFRYAGNTNGPDGPIPLAEHTCARPGPVQGCLYVSAMPSADDDPYVVPFCGCRPRQAGYIPGSSQAERAAELDAARVPYKIYEFGRDEPA